MIEREKEIWELRRTLRCLLKRKKKEIKSKNIKREKEEEKENKKEKNASKRVRRLLIIKENRRIKDVAMLLKAIWKDMAKKM